MFFKKKIPRIDYKYKQIIQDWLNEATNGSKECPAKVCLIKRSIYDTELVLASNYAGYLIGYHGLLFENYTNKLKECGFTKIRLIEIDEIFNSGDDWNEISMKRDDGFFEYEGM